MYIILIRVGPGDLGSLANVKVVKFHVRLDRAIHVLSTQCPRRRYRKGETQPSEISKKSFYIIWDERSPKPTLTFEYLIGSLVDF